MGTAAPHRGFGVEPLRSLKNNLKAFCSVSNLIFVKVWPYNVADLSQYNEAIMLVKKYPDHFTPPISSGAGS